MDQKTREDYEELIEYLQHKCREKDRELHELRMRLRQHGSNEERFWQEVNDY